MSRQPDGSTSVNSMQDAHDFYNHHAAAGAATGDAATSSTTDTIDAHPLTNGRVSTFDMDAAFISSPPSLDGYTTAAPASTLPFRSDFGSPTRAASRSISSPVPSISPLLDETATQPGPSSAAARTQQRSIKDLVNRFNQAPAADSHLARPASRERDVHRRPSEQRTRLQKLPRSPTTKTRTASAPHGKLHSHGVSSGLAAVAAPHMALSGMTAAQPTTSPSRRKLHKSLFGEVAFELNGVQQPGYGIPDAHLRRGSEGNINVAYPAHQQHKRSRSDAYFHLPTERRYDGTRHETHLAVDASAPHHRRSRSAVVFTPEEAARYYQALPQIDTNVRSSSQPSQQNLSPSASSLHNSTPGASSPDRPSRIPISSNRRPSAEPTSPTSRLPLSRGASRNHFPGPNSPKSKKNSKENLSFRSDSSGLPALAPRRYDPFASQRQAQSGQSLKAFIKAEPLQQSPPLRSSRPRQPVSQAATTAPRGKAGQRFESNVLKKDGSGSDTNRYRSKKTIPELGKIDFAARKAKIQRAISANLPADNASDQGSVSARSSFSEARSRQHSISESDVIGSIESSDEAAPNGYRHMPERNAAAANGLGLSLETNGRPIDSFLSGPYSADTSFEESPVASFHHGTESSPSAPQLQISNSDGQTSNEPVTLLSQVMRMRERSSSSTSRTDIESSPAYSPAGSPTESPDVSLSEIDDRGSIQIVLDSSPILPDDDWPLDPGTARQENFPSAPATARQEHFPLTDETIPESELESFDSDAAEVGSSPWIGADDRSVPATPQKEENRQLLNPHHEEDDDVTPRQPNRIGRSSVIAISSDWNRDSDAYYAVSRILEQYRTSGDMTPEILHEFERHVQKLSPDLSKFDNSDDGTFKVLLDSLMADQNGQPKPAPPPESPYMHTTLYSPADSGIMDSPEQFRPGTAIIYSQPSRQSTDTHSQNDETQDMLGQYQNSPSSLVVNTPASQFVNTPMSQFASTPMSQFGPHSDAVLGAEEEEEEYRPPPPPKDDGYSPRLSTGHVYEGLDQAVSFSARQSRASIPASVSVPPSIRPSASFEILRLPEIPTGDGLGLAISVEPPSTTAANAPPLPIYLPPPPPPPPADSKKPPPIIFTETEHSSAPASMPTSPVLTRTITQEEKHRNFSTPASSRPSTESRKPAPITLPPSQSFASFQSSIRDDGTQPPTPNPEHRRLLKRKHVIKELLDTEFSYHQDMKIIEDIYRGTVGDMISADDKKVLFGNSDQVEGFSLEFYDALRRAVTGVYVPVRNARRTNKRGSFSTSTSGERESGISEPPDEERDSTTRVGECFAHFLTPMEKIYGAYLRNHDAANQRLAKLQGEATVKTWLDMCHTNASDITSAWDLDSLLVKPVQRILKYPLLLQQLLESTPSGHPDHKALEYAVKEIMNVTHRINEAKKRADLVEQMVTRKRKESDVRSGLAKAFGRRTEKLKERVGIAEAYQDNDFDELAHKFGGHFIRLQVCMRDVQGSIAEVDKAVHHFHEFANALEAFIEVSPSTSPEIESKWRKFILAIRELATVALPDHKLKVQNSVIKPMLTAIELHKGPQNAIQKRKKRILDYAKCKTMEKAGQKPDKKSLEACELYEALNEQLKLELPRLYSLTADLIKACLDNNIILQTNWMWLWKEKIAPVLDYVPRPNEPDNREMIHPDNITPAFMGDYDIIHSQVLGLGLCNGSLLAEASNFLSPQTTLVGDESIAPSRATSRVRRPSNISNGKSGQRKMSIETSPYIVSPELEKSFSSTMPPSPSLSAFPNGGPGFYGRMRSSSSLSARGRTPTIQQSSSGNAISSTRMPSLASKSSFSGSRPSTANRPGDLQTSISRTSVDTFAKRSPRPESSGGYFPGHVELAPHRFSGMFSSAMPMSDSPVTSSGPTSPKNAPEDTPVMFVAASLFEFNIDKARREAGYPYLTYVEGEVFDVVAQKGELWLAKNQDDSGNSLGWIWEQHFVILSQDA